MSERRKRPPKPAARQRKAMELIRQGKKAKHAMIEAGYSPRTAELPGELLINTPGARADIAESAFE